MRWFLSAVLYTALSLGANPSLGQNTDLESLREGSMKKLVFLDTPVVAPEIPFTDASGVEHRLSDWRGQYVLVNFWATWCAPCRKELPALDALNRDFATKGFAVLTIATGRNPVPAITRLFAEVGVETLPILLDPSQDLSREMGVFGLPVSVLLDAEGHEIARLSGDADWNGASARAIISTLTGG
ncbi:MAG: TlpA disulfide reductase family protein [Albidovulum sp.]